MASLSYAGEKVQIATVLSSSIKPYNDALRAFYKTLSEGGVLYEHHEFLLDGTMEEDELVAKLKALGPDLIHTVGTKSTLIVKDHIKDIPVVFSMVLNPVASGLVDSMNRPGASITGAAMDIPLKLQFQYIKLFLPEAYRIGVIYNAEETGPVVADAEKVARDLDFELVKAGVHSSSDVSNALKSLTGKVDFLWAVADSNVFTKETTREILLVTLREAIPFMGLSPAFVRAGALIAMETDPEEIGREAAAIAVQVFSGRPPGDIPVTVSERVKVVINKNTMDLTGVELPKEIHADVEVITP